MPDVVKGEFVNFGLAMIETSSSGGSFADVRFTRDWRRVLCFDPQADIEILQALEADIRKRVIEVRNCEEIMRVLNDSFSNAIQFTEATGCLSDDPTKEIEEMAKIYLESPRARGARELSGRERIVVSMRDAWESAGVLGLIKPFPVAQYTGPGDSFAFDFAYLLGKQIKLFHAVSLGARVDSAVTLAARYPKIADGMKNALHFPLTPQLTVVVDDDLDMKQIEIGFALGMMRDSGIRVSEVREMPRIAAVAREELGA